MIVALFTRAWIEISNVEVFSKMKMVALFTRAWIEIPLPVLYWSCVNSRPLHEGVD